MSLLLLHSSGLGGRQWARLLGRLPPEVRCSAPNLAGYGEVPWDPGTPAELADLGVAEAALARLPAPVDVVGHSYGGVLALALARRRPERVGRLVLHEPIAMGVLRGADAPEWAALDASIRAMFRSGPAGGERWMRAFVDFWGGAGAWDGLPAVRRRALLAVGPKVAAEVRGLGDDDRPAEHWAEVPHPTLITVGARSPTEERALCARLASAMPDARLVEVEADHMAPVTALDAVMPAWSAFLGL